MLGRKGMDSAKTGNLLGAQPHATWLLFHPPSQASPHGGQKQPEVLVRATNSVHNS